MKSIKKNSGFTLIELLVIITIILILIGLVSFGVSRGMSRIKTMQCIGNLKNLHQAVMLYSTETWGNPYQTCLPDDLDAAFLKNFVGNEFQSTKCPLSPSDTLGYKINKEIEDNWTTLENLNTYNILLYEITEDKPTSTKGTIATRHGENCYGITVYGDIQMFNSSDDKRDFLPNT